MAEATALAIETKSLRKVYPAPPTVKRRGSTSGWPPSVGGTQGSPRVPGVEIIALESLDLNVREGELFGLLGPNGAGKTTTLGILTTRVAATSGHASVAGADVVNNPVEVRRRIGVVPQRPNPDRGLSIVENLVFHAAYFGMPRQPSTQKAMALLEQLGLVDRAHARVDELSGGQQQRLIIARALIHEPSILFLDEPTVGLDPQARLALWDILRRLHSEGRTIVMTTHYMEEADKLCDRLAIIDQGRLLALDTPQALKSRAPGGTLVELHLDGDAQAAATAAGSVPGIIRADATRDVLRAYSDRGGRVISPLIDAVEQSGRTVKNIDLAEPSLETLFISLTGRKLT
jgi:ABC-2 type transport system ATP-binding protein